MVFARSVQVDQHHQKMDLHAQLARSTKFLSMENAHAGKDLPIMKQMSVSSAHPFPTDSYKMDSAQFVLET